MKRRLVLVALAAAVLAGGAAGSAPFRIGLVVSVGSRPDSRTVGGLMYVGFVRAAKEPGVEGRVVEFNGDPTGTILSLARKHYDVIVLPFFNGVDPTWAAKYPTVRFLIPDGAGGKSPEQGPKGPYPGRPQDLLETVFRSEQAAYLAGYLAALVEAERPGKHVISSVAGTPEGQVQALVAGYQAGAHKADPQITTLNDYTYDYSIPAKCRPAALSQIAKGSGVVFDVAGICGLGALDAAKEKGVWAVGVDVDQSYLGPFILTSVLKHEDTALVAAIEAVRRGTFPKDGDMVFDLGNGGVGLARTSPKVSRAILRRLDRIRAQIVAGTIKVPTRLGK